MNTNQPWVIWERVVFGLTNKVKFPNNFSQIREITLIRHAGEVF